MRSRMRMNRVWSNQWWLGYSLSHSPTLLSIPVFHNAGSQAPLHLRIFYLKRPFQVVKLRIWRIFLDLQRRFYRVLLRYKKALYWYALRCHFESCRNRVNVSKHADFELVDEIRPTVFVIALARGVSWPDLFHVYHQQCFCLHSQHLRVSHSAQLAVSICAHQ